MSEVIDARALFAGARSGAGEDPIAAKLKSLARLPPAERTIMTANLGRLAVRISPENPKSGARSIFKELGGDWEALWKKRKRFLVLPGEQPAADAIGSSGATFVVLAEAAGSILAAGQGGDLIKRSRREAVRDLVSGTQWAPLVPSISDTMATGGELLAEGLNRLAVRARESTSIQDLWSVLDETPFGITPIDDEERSAVLSEPLGSTKLIACDIAHTEFRGGLGAKFDHKDQNTDWADPTLKLGMLAVQRRLSIFRVHPEAAHHFLELEDDAALSEGQAWLDQIGFGAEGGGLPDTLYSNERGYGWAQQDFWQLYSVQITLSEGDQVAFEFHSRDGMYELVPSTNPGADPAILKAAASHAHSFSHWSPIEGYHTLGLRLPEWWNHSKPPAGDFLGWVRGDCNEDPEQLRGSLRDDNVRPWILSGEGLSFLPNFEVDATTPPPLPSESVGAAILRNLVFAKPEYRLDTLITDRARALALAGLRYHSEVLTYYRDRLVGKL